ncbi:MAG: cupin domain-containing protein [Verrucomicrobiota bacterium]
MIHNIETGETVYDQDGGKGIRLYEAGGNEYVHLTIQPGSGIFEHSLPLAVSFYVLKGSGICTMSGKATPATEGDMLECPPDELRSWKNASDKPLEVRDRFPSLRSGEAMLHFAGSKWRATLRRSHDAGPGF